MQQSLPTVEGLSPVILWYTLVGLVGIGALVVLADKVGDVFRKRKQRKEDEKSKGDSTVLGQLDKINKKLDTIDDFMKETNNRFDRDNRRLNALEKQTDETMKGIRALAKASLAHLQHDITGNHVDRLRDAEKCITDYLTEK